MNKLNLERSFKNKFLMKEKLKKVFCGLFTFIFLVCTPLICFQAEVVSASESGNSVFIKKFSKSYTKKFCNAIGFGLSKESAMNFSLEETKQEFKKIKEIKDINKEILAEKIANSVVDQCGYPINLSGEKGVLDFKLYYISKDN